MLSLRRVHARPYVTLCHQVRYLPPGDARFHVILYPHLFHEGWQCLEILKIGGVNMLFKDDYYTIRTLRGGVV